MPATAYCQMEQCTAPLPPYAGVGRKRKYCVDCARRHGPAKRRQHTLVCAHCGTTFNNPKARVRYCSTACLEAWRTAYYADVTLRCAVCDREFIGHRARKYCSIECRSQRQRSNYDPIGRLLTPIQRRDERAYIAALKHDPCAYCGAPQQHVDHIEPRLRDGCTHWTNFTAACARCNGLKNSTELLHFLGRQRLQPELVELIDQARLWSNTDREERIIANLSKV